MANPNPTYSPPLLNNWASEEVEATSSTHLDNKMRSSPQGPIPVMPYPNKPTVQPSFATVLEQSSSNKSFYETMMTSFGDLLGFLGSTPCFMCFCPNPYRQINQGHVGLICHFGKCRAIVDPGLHSVNPLTEKIQSVDIRIQIDELPRQDIMTKDNVMVSLDSVVYWHVIDPYKATFLVSDARAALRERTQTTLRHILGSREVQDCIENREALAREIQIVIDGPAHEWGLKVESILIKDIGFGQQLQESLASAATQKRVGAAKVILARAEVESAKLMREASDILATPAAMQIRYLETLLNMSKSSGTKVIFMPPNLPSKEGLKAVAEQSMLEQL